MTAPLPPAQMLQDFAVSAPVHVAQTARATVWRVALADGRPAALKLYHETLTNEAPGVELVRHWAGAGVVEVYQVKGVAVLMEWLEGPSLGDLVRAGDDVVACQHLLEVVQNLRANADPGALELDPLALWFDDLFQARVAPAAPVAMQATLRRATELAQDLLADADPPRALHGDLHHDNIRQSDRGWLAFDAKGVLGDPHFEVANAFRNPIGAEDIYRARRVIRQRADIWAAGLSTTPARLLQWAAAYAALSLCWTAQGMFTAEHAQDVQLIDRFIEMIDG